jgi:hypothetical protein
MNAIDNTPTEPRPEANPQATPASDAPTPESRARALFRAADEAKPFDSTDVSFALEDDLQAFVSGNLRQPGAVAQVVRPRRAGALRPSQWIVLGIMLLVECIILGGLAYLIFTAGR